MTKCFSCCDSKKLSKEHIIPQAIGGKLSARIYCKDCNDQFGKEIDHELVKGIGYFATGLNIKRGRGKNRPYDVTWLTNGTVLTFDGKEFRRKKPTVKIERDDERIRFIDIRAGSKKEIEEISSKIKKKYKLIDEIKKMEDCHAGPTETVMDFVFDNSPIRRCVSKIAYSLMCIKLPSEVVFSSSFDEVRNYIRYGSRIDLASANYVSTGFMTDYVRPLHKIHIALNRRRNLVIGFVCFFGTFRYTVLLSNSFKSSLYWPGLDHTINPVTGSFIYGNPHFKAPELEIPEILSPKHSRRLVLNELEKGHKIIENYVKDHRLLKIEAEEKS